MRTALLRPNPPIENGSEALCLAHSDPSTPNKWVKVDHTRQSWRAVNQLLSWRTRLFTLQPLRTGEPNQPRVWQLKWRLQFLSLCIFCKTAHHAPQRMVCSASSLWLASGDPWTGAMATTNTIAINGPECRDSANPRQMEKRRPTKSSRRTEFRHSARACPGCVAAGSQSRSRSSIATCQKPGQRCHAQSRNCPRGDVRSRTSQSGEIGGNSRRWTRSRCFSSSIGTCQCSRSPQNGADAEIRSRRSTVEQQQPCDFWDSREWLAVVCNGDSWSSSLSSCPRKDSATTQAAQQPHHPRQPTRRHLPFPPDNSGKNSDLAPRRALPRPGWLSLPWRSRLLRALTRVASMARCALPNISNDFQTSPVQPVEIPDENMLAITWVPPSLQIPATTLS